MTEWYPSTQRVVATGMGAITPNGLDVPTTWDNVKNGRSGIGEITLFDVSDYQVKIAGEAWGFDPRNYMTGKEARRADRNVQFAIAAADEAVRQAKLQVDSGNAHQIGVSVGSGAGGIATYQEQQRILNKRGPKSVSPMLIPMIVTDSAAVQLSIRFGTTGPCLSTSSACSTSIDTVGNALEIIRRGDAEVMLAGGTEAAINTLGVSGFDQLRSLSRRNDNPAGASRPFDRGRDGFVLSEGAVVLVLESLDHAQKRGATPLFELRSYAVTSDGSHATAPDGNGNGARRCLNRALEKGALHHSEIGYINAHATATPVGDPVEAHVIRQTFDGQGSELKVSSTKSTTGHLLGAAGALALALAGQAIHEGWLPPTINLDDPDPECDLNHIINVGVETSTHAALVPSYGFGGHNSCLAITKWEE